VCTFFENIESKVVSSIFYTYLIEIYARAKYFLHMNAEDFKSLKLELTSLLTEATKFDSQLNTQQKRDLITAITVFIDKYKRNIEFVIGDKGSSRVSTFLDIDMRIYHEYFAKIANIYWMAFDHKKVHLKKDSQESLPVKDLMFNINKFINVEVAKAIVSFTQSIINALPLHMRKDVDAYTTSLNETLSKLMSSIKDKAKTASGGGGEGDGEQGLSSPGSSFNMSQEALSSQPIDAASQGEITSAPTDDTYETFREGEDDNSTYTVNVPFEDLYPEETGHADPILAAITQLPYSRKWSLGEELTYEFLLNPATLYTVNMYIIDDWYKDDGSASTGDMAEGGAVSWTLEDYHRKYYPPYAQLYYDA
jgi:hypothetical protein